MHRDLQRGATVGARPAACPGWSIRGPAAGLGHRQWWRRRAVGRTAAVASAAELPPGRHLRTEELARLEAALFLAREPLSTRRLAKLARLADGTRARTLLRELRRLQDAGGMAMRVEQIAGGFQLLSRAAFGPWIRRLHDHPATARISAAGLETLAIVAYRQPVTRAEIEAIRGVGSEEMLRQLLDRDLVAIGGRAEDLGRPNVYVTTRRFLAAFGLAGLEDLPPIETLTAPTADPPPAES
ncbi:MAG: SMC-Scp complex subunit ScpB [Planctomycetota bacterium]